MSVTRELQAVVKQAAGAVVERAAIEVERLAARYHEACASAGVVGLGADDEAAQVGRQLSDARGRHQDAIHSERDRRAEVAHATRLLTGAEREAMHAAEEKGHRAEAVALDKRHAEKQAVIGTLRETLNQTVALAARQSDALLRSVIANAEGRASEGADVPKQDMDFAQLRVPMIEKALAKYEAEARELLDQRDAALAAADESHRAMLAARTDRLELACAEAASAFLPHYAMFVEAHRIAHDITPPAPDFAAMLARPSANDDEAEPVPKRTRRFAFWSR